MKLLNFYYNDTLHLGVKNKQGILDITESLKVIPGKNVPSSMDEIFKNEDSINILQEYINGIATEGIYREEDLLNFESCVPSPGKIVGVGLNYYDYLKSANLEKPEYPRLFNKYSGAVVGHRGIVRIPNNGTQVDYEGELAVVIGKKARLIDTKNALDYVFGYCNANDVSCRDFQDLTPSWLPGKACDTFAPLGPYLVTADEVANPNNLQLKTFLNGELRQNTSTGEMIRGIPELISYISKFFTLMPGDVILTGSPDGMIICYPEKERVWVKDGDIMEVEVGNLGRLVSYAKDEEI